MTVELLPEARAYRELLRRAVSCAKHFASTLAMLAAIVTLPAVTFFALSDHGAEAFALAKDKPWGIVTSWLAHGDANHLLSNVWGVLPWGAALIISFIVITCLSCKHTKIPAEHIANRLKETWILGLTIAQLLPSTYQYTQLSSGVKILGASLLAYGTHAIAIALTPLTSSVIGLSLPVPLKPRKRRPPRALLMLRDIVKSNLHVIYIIVALLILLAIINSPSFAAYIGLGVPRANVPGHALALLSSFLASTLYLSLLVHEMATGRSISIKKRLKRLLLRAAGLLRKLTLRRVVLLILVLVIVYSAAHRPEAIAQGYVYAYKVLSAQYSNTVTLLGLAAVFLSLFTRHSKEYEEKVPRLFLTALLSATLHITSTYISTLEPPNKYLPLAYFTETFSYILLVYATSILLPLHIIEKYTSELLDIVIEPIKRATIATLLFIAIFPIGFTLIAMLRENPAIFSIVLQSFLERILDSILLHIPILLSLILVLLAPTIPKQAEDSEHSNSHHSEPDTKWADTSKLCRNRLQPKRAYA